MGDRQGARPRCDRIQQLKPVPNVPVVPIDRGGSQSFKARNRYSRAQGVGTAKVQSLNGLVVRVFTTSHEHAGSSFTTPRFAPCQVHSIMTMQITLRLIEGLLFPLQEMTSQCCTVACSCPRGFSCGCYRSGRRSPEIYRSREENARRCGGNRWKRRDCRHRLS